MKENGAAATTVNKVRWKLQDLAAPLAKRPIAEITPAEILAHPQEGREKRQAGNRKKVRRTIGKVFGSRSQRSGPPPTRPMRSKARCSRPSSIVVRRSPTRSSSAP